MAIHHIYETVQVELVIDLPDDSSQQGRSALIDAWRRAIQVTVADPLGQSLLSNPYLRALIYAPVSPCSQYGGASNGEQVGDNATEHEETVFTEGSSESTPSSTIL